MIQILTQAELNDIVKYPDGRGEHKPYGLFLSHENGKWVACDNSEGDAWTEEFDTIEDAVDWLNSDESKEELEERKRRLSKPAFQDPLDRPVTLRDVVRLVQWFHPEVTPNIMGNKSKQFEAWMGGPNA